VEQEHRLVDALLRPVVDALDRELPGVAAVGLAEDRALQRDAIADLELEARERNFSGSTGKIGNWFSLSWYLPPNQVAWAASTTPGRASSRSS
jgi:hypothetical protein